MEDRLAAIDRLIELAFKMIDFTADVLSAVRARAFALQQVLEAKGYLSDEEVAERMRAIDDTATLEIELAPEFEEFRRLRQAAREALEREASEQQRKNEPKPPNQGAA